MEVAAVEIHPDLQENIQIFATVKTGLFSLCLTSVLGYLMAMQFSMAFYNRLFI